MTNVLAVSLAVCLVCGGYALAQPPRHVADETAPLPCIISRIPPPAIDGRVDPREWKGAAVIASFVEAKLGGPPKAQTRACFAHDDGAVYIGIVCDEPLMSRAAQTRFDRHDSGIWNNDCIEVFLNPQADRASYIHFIVDILNQRYDALGRDSFGFNPSWRSATRRDAHSWSVEIAIPFASLGVQPPTPGQAWLGNICRERKAEPELSAWRPTHGSFEAPGSFGLIIFDSLKAYLRNQAAAISAEAERWPAQMSRESGTWRSRFGPWQTRVSAMNEGAVRASYPTLAAQLADITSAMGPLRVKAMRLASGGRTFAITQAWPYEQFSGEPSPLDRPVAPIEIGLLRGEWIDLAWNITNLTDRSVTLRCTARHGEPSDFLALGLPGLDGSWREAMPVATGDGRQMYDALVPVPSGVVRVPPGATSQVWLSLHAPVNTAGTVAGRVVIEPVDGTPGDPVVVPLAATVIPVDITSRPQPVHCFTWNLVRLEDPAWSRAHLLDLRAHGVDVCWISSLHYLPRVKANRDGSLAAPLDFAKLDALLDAAQGIFDQYYITMDIWEKASLRHDLFGLSFDDPAYEGAFKAWMAQVVAHLKARGLGYDNFVVNPVDESVDDRCRRIARWIKDVDPQVRIIIDSIGGTQEDTGLMDALTDVWTPHYKSYQNDALKPSLDLIRASGKPMWVYYYSEGSNEKAQDPTRHYLAKFWWAFSTGVTGVCYWAQQYYGDPWYRKGTTAVYDTSLVYPIESDVVASRRWEAWRRGGADYCLLAGARGRLRAAGDTEGLKRLDAFVRETLAAPVAPGRRDEARTWLRAQIAASP